MASASEARAVLPDLRIVPLDDLLFHEDVDLERVARLIDRLSRDGVLRNPPIVASLSGSDRFLLLDGANRVSALRHLEVPHVLVQVESFDDPELAISHWNHVVRDIEAAAVRGWIEKTAALRAVPGRADAPALRAEPDYVCSVVFGEDEALHLLGGGDLRERVALLRSLHRVYARGPARMDRVAHLDIAAIRRHYPHCGAVVAFPDFPKAAVRELAESGERLPSGVTRILVPRRVLGFNLRLALLQSHLPLEEKRRWLEEAIEERLAERRVRYYEEPTFVFDD